MSSHATKIRGACEQCHRRKIRCILGANETKCVNCLHNNTECLFAPRAKPGRPRKDAGKEPKPARPAQDHLSSGSEANTPLFAQPLQHEQSIASMPEFKLDPFEAEANWNSMFWGELEDHSSSVSDSFSLGCNNFFPGSGTSMTTTFTHPDSGMVSSWSPPSMVPALLSPADVDELDFDTTLQHCKRLDEYDHQMTRVTMSPSDEKDMFSIMTKLCTAAATKIPSSSHCPAAALSLAAVLKVLEVCRKLTVTTVNPNMHRVLSLKEVDLLLLQAKYFLTEVGQHAAVSQAMDLHSHIEATINNNWPAFKW